MLCMQMWQPSNVLLDTLHSLLSIDQVAACIERLHLTASNATIVIPINWCLDQLTRLYDIQNMQNEAKGRDA